MPGREVILARLRRPWGRRGELLAELHTDWPGERFVPGARYLLELPDGTRREVTVRGWRRLGDRDLLAFDGVTGIGDAEDLAGGVLLAPAEALPDLAEGEPCQADLPGLVVELPDGRRVGVVEGVEEAPGGDLLVVRLDGGGEALVPLAPAITREIDPAGGRVVIDPPEGLLDPDRAVPAGRPGGRAPRRGAGR